MMFGATHCKESRRIMELNWNYLQVIRHLQWQGRGSDLKVVMQLPAEEALLLSSLDQESTAELLETRVITLFSLELSEAELTAAVQEKAARQLSPLGGLITHHSSLLTLAENPARSFLKTVLLEIQNWGAFSTNTAYRFSVRQSTVAALGELDTAGLIKLAQSESTVLKPRFNLAQLSALGKTGLVPSSLLFD